MKYVRFNFYHLLKKNTEMEIWEHNEEITEEV